MSLGEFIGSGSGITKGLYHLNGNSNDSSGNGNNGTDTNISYVNGKFGQCASFNGSSSKIAIPNGALISSNSARTVSCWVNVSSLPANNTSFTVFGYGAASNNQSFGINLAQISGNYCAVLFCYANDLQYNFTYSTGIWYHLCATYDGTNTKLYLNGSLVGTRNVGSQSTSATNGAIGSYVAANTNFLNGLSDEVIIENVAWSAEKVKKYYTMTKGRFGIN